MINNNMAGLALKGGRRGNFYFCLIEHFPEQNRWFLKSLLRVKDESDVEADDVVKKWLETYQVSGLVVDIPLSSPSCRDCTLACPGHNNCPVESVKEVNGQIKKILQSDVDLQEDDPKDYERKRLKQEEYLKVDDKKLLISRAYRRKLKKGFLPYWNRTIDFWVWQQFYDELLDVFNVSFDSFGNTSLMMLSRFAYMQRHFPESVHLYEASSFLTLLGLNEARIIDRRDLLNLQDLDLAPDAKLAILKKVESKLNLFIYDHDLEILVRNPRAFDSFLLALTGQRVLKGKIINLPDWTRPNETRFALANFS